MVRGKGSLNSQLAGKQYKDGINDVIKNTAVRPSDLDTKAMALLDVLQQRGRSTEVCDYLKEALADIPRDKIQNWRGYVYTLLRGFDEEAYASMKAEKGGDKKRGGAKEKEVGSPDVRPNAIESVKREKHNLNQAATEFVPGKPWYSSGAATQKKNPFNPDVPEFVPGQVTWGAGVGEAKTFSAPVAPVSQKPASAPKAKSSSSGKAPDKKAAEPAPKARPDRSSPARPDSVNGTKAAQRTVAEPTAAAEVAEQPKAENKVQADDVIVAPVTEPWWQNKGVVVLGLSVLVAAFAVPVMQKRFRSNKQ